MGRNDLVEIRVDEVQAVTAKAVLCSVDGTAIWLPLSQCWDGGAVNWNPEVGDLGVLVELPEWLAEEKGVL